MCLTTSTRSCFIQRKGTATCKIRPIKAVEWMIVIIDIIVIFLVSDNQYASYFKDLLIFQFIFAILWVIGVPYKKGYKYMPLAASFAEIFFCFNLLKKLFIKSCLVKALFI